MTAQVERSYRFAAIPEWVLTHPDLLDSDVRVFGMLDRHDGVAAFPSVDRLAQLLGRSDDTIRRSVRRLERVGAVQVVERFDDGGRQTSNLYRLASDRPFDAAPMRGRSRTAAGDVPRTAAGDEARTGARGTRARGTRATGKRDTTAPLPGLPAAEPAADGTLAPGSDPFASFWSRYPRKTGRAEAVRAFGARGCGARLAAVLDGLDRWVAYWQAEQTEERFIPHAATWLRDDRWSQQPPALRRKAGQVITHPAVGRIDTDRAAEGGVIDLTI